MFALQGCLSFVCCRLTFGTSIRLDARQNPPGAWLMKPQEIRALVTSDGLVSRRIFVDAEIYRLELERIFTRCWLYLGHESQLPHPGDYFTTYMGEDPVLIWKSHDGHVGAYLNSCLHRGTKLCNADAGNTRMIVCPFHGWTYNSDGELAAAPYQEMYFGSSGLPRLRLREVPKMANYGGLLFGCWDAGAESLDQYLGDLRWYLDILLESRLGGLEVVPGSQRYTVPANWKLQAENFTGDAYHLPTTHAWMFKLRTDASGQETITDTVMQQCTYSLAFDHGHGLLETRFNSEAYEADMIVARRLGPEVVEYVGECRHQLEKRLSPRQVAIHSWGVGNIFPNFGLMNLQLLLPVDLYAWQPKGPDSIDIWQWCALDRGAPKIVKERALRYFVRHQSAAGFFGQDDSHNFEQVTAATRGAVSRAGNFIYQMGMGQEDTVGLEGYPGHFGQRISEICQRGFYNYWAEIMSNGE
jgi:dibenzofuran dioxygenase subunit alpha